MKDTECNKFFTLLMGECWHEWQEIFLTNNHTVSSVASLRCKHCETDKYFATENYDHLSNPIPVIRWMEKNMPEVWESYLDHIRDVQHEERTEYDTAPTYTDFLILALDLRNLVDYLWENQEWGEKKCDSCISGISESSYAHTKYCPICHGTGKIIHPALQYLKEVKG